MVPNKIPTRKRPRTYGTERRTPQGTYAHRLYGRRWSRARTAYLFAHPWCVQCKANGSLVPATQVDHIVPHNGNRAMFWDSRNWQGLCTSCHSKKTSTEDGGFGNQTAPVKSLQNGDGNRGHGVETFREDFKSDG